MSVTRAGVTVPTIKLARRIKQLRTKFTATLNESLTDFRHDK